MHYDALKWSLETVDTNPLSRKWIPIRCLVGHEDFSLEANGEVAKLLAHDFVGMPSKFSREPASHDVGEGGSPEITEAQRIQSKCLLLNVLSCQEGVTIFVVLEPAQ